MPSQNVYAFLDEMVREYEEKSVLERAAVMFRDNKRDGVVPNVRAIQLLSGMYPREVVLIMVAKYDADQSGGLDAQEMLQLIRHLNFSTGYCDECMEPIGEGETGFGCMEWECSNLRFLLCPPCSAWRHQYHPKSHRFTQVSSVDDWAALEGEDFPRGTGVILMEMVKTLFQTLDVDRSGTVSHNEFRQHFRWLGYQEDLIDYLLQFDVDGDGEISTRELTYLLVGLNTTRMCDECGCRKFIASKSINNCLECLQDYDICDDCYNTHRRYNHPHQFFKKAESFQLREAGLVYQRLYGSTWELRVADPVRNETYRPFIEDKMQQRIDRGEMGNGYGEPATKPNSQNQTFSNRTNEDYAPSLATFATEGGDMYLGDMAGQYLFGAVGDAGAGQGCLTDASGGAGAGQGCLTDAA